MQHRKKTEELSVMDAVDNLTQMAEIDLTTSPKQRTDSLAGLTDEQVGEHLHALSWQDAEYFLYNRERIKATFQVLLNYLKELYEKQRGNLRDVHTQKGVQAIMLLATEAVQKMDNYTHQIMGSKKEESITQFKEYQELQQFYQSKILQKFHNYAEIKEGWQNEWGAVAEEETSGDKAQGLRDLDTVRRDREYELFMVRREDGKPFFNRGLLRHLHLVGEFDTIFTETSGEDLFVRIKAIEDRDLHASAKEILHIVAPHLDDYYREALRYKDVEFVASINSAVMALMLAGNPRNLMQTSSGKSCRNYFIDFHYYLRKALSSPEYVKYIAHPSETPSPFFHLLLKLAYGLNTSFFMRVGNRREMVNLIRTLIEEGAKNSSVQAATHSPVALWNNLIDEDEQIRYMLRKHPNGPLMKAVGIFQQDNQLIGYDPLAQENFPSQLYTLVNDQMHISCLRLPSPSRQEYVNKVELAEEFYGFLRAIASEKKGQRHLLINLQDRTSWQEHARSVALEDLQKKGEYAKSLVVATLPKDGDFYWQLGSYLDDNEAKGFIKGLKEQIAGGEQCGYFLSGVMNSKELQEFSHQAIQTIHHLFFGDKSTLLRKNRLDFIEIFFLFLTLKIIDICQPDTVSFTCKDAIDTGAAAYAAFYAFLRMMSGTKPWGKEEKDFFLWMVYSAALILRDRVIDGQRYRRMLSALAIINAETEAQHQEVVRTCSKLYTLSFFSDLAIQEAC